MPDISQFGTPALAGLLGAAALLIAYVGTRLARMADTIADRTGLGEALIGSVLLGAGTSMSGIVTSISTAAGGAPDLSVANAQGGIAAQTMFLALADIAYRRVNLEHAAASAVNLAQANVLIILTILPILAWSLPEVAFFGVHPITLVLIAAYGIGLKNAHSVKRHPMWVPRQTDATRDEDADETPNKHSNLFLGLAFFALTAVVGVAGWAVGQAGIELSTRSGISEGVVGALITAVITSLPELVTTIAAVRAGALQLAVGGIIGGNMFDALFVAASDVAYQEGSIYHAIDSRTIFWFMLVLLMTAVLLMGLLRRERQGPAGIGWESVLLLGLWAGGAAVQGALG
ncbi:cation transporter [Pacificimonas flava]|uniref:Cation transporter n=1 Tax=Pacificimonas flava TaxID=1234595 RepID=A0A219B1W1_9SPHN|nr:MULTISPECIES: sodium:calcium antiporter [Pacificimonas]OWV31799.1 cation transporter [Pacificimonas flava]